MSSNLLDMYVLEIATVCTLGPCNHLLSDGTAIKQAAADFP
jgi:hypothetical protein